jgi:hypothetical protein
MLKIISQRWQQYKEAVSESQRCKRLKLPSARAKTHRWNFVGVRALHDLRTVDEQIQELDDVERPKDEGYVRFVEKLKPLLLDAREVLRDYMVQLRDQKFSLLFQKPDFCRGRRDIIDQDLFDFLQNLPWEAADGSDRNMVGAIASAVQEHAVAGAEDAAVSTDAPPDAIGSVPHLQQNPLQWPHVLADGASAASTPQMWSVIQLIDGDAESSSVNPSVELFDNHHPNAAKRPRTEALPTLPETVPDFSQIDTSTVIKQAAAAAAERVKSLMAARRAR